MCVLAGAETDLLLVLPVLYAPGTDTYLFGDILASLDGHVAQVRA
jgi:hypothetical protein